MIVFESRAATILYNIVINTNPSKTFLLQANVCPIVPLVLLKANRKYELVDISCSTFCMNEELVLDKISKNKHKYSGIIFVRTYGVIQKVEEFFRNIKSINDEIIIIDDRCLCVPEFISNFNNHADIVLYSTGYSKYIDIGFGGFANIKDTIQYKNDVSIFHEKYLTMLIEDYKNAIKNNTRFVYKELDWLDTRQPEISFQKYKDSIEGKVSEIRDHKQSLNKIYSENLPEEIQLEEGFQHWRFNIIVPEKGILIKKIFEKGLFASSHYASLGGIFSCNQFNSFVQSSTLYSQIVNLFNDKYFNIEQALDITKVIKDHIKRLGGKEFMVKKKLIIIGAGEFQLRLVDAARNLGYETHVFAWEAGAVCKDIADCFYPISIADKNTILGIARKINPHGVISVGSDLAVPTVNYIANELCLIGNSRRSTDISTNKYEMRKALKAKGLPCPSFIMVGSNEPLNMQNMHYPLIIKPVDRSGSRGVTLVSDPDILNPAIKNARQHSFIGQAIVEEYFPGTEYSMEMISYKRKHHFLAITEKFTTGAPNFVETMHLQPGRIEDSILKKAIAVMKQALDALSIEYGASHSEFKVDDDGNIMIIEIGARMGGDFIGSDLVPLSTGCDFTRMVIDVAVGKEPDFLVSELIEKAALVKFIFSKTDLALLKNIQKNHVDKIFAYEDIRDITSEVVENSSQRFGYFILHCNTREECLQLVEVH